MTGHAWLDVIISVSAALVLSWLALIVALAIGRPKGSLLKEALRLLPDLLRLLKRLTTDRTLPTGVRVQGRFAIYLSRYPDRSHSGLHSRSGVCRRCDHRRPSFCAVCAVACPLKNCERLARHR
jgi:hypothetical protein